MGGEYWGRVGGGDGGGDGLEVSRVWGYERRINGLLWVWFAWENSLGVMKEGFGKVERSRIEFVSRD